MNAALQLGALALAAAVLSVAVRAQRPEFVLPLQIAAAAVCLVTRLCAAFCKDSGNEALAAVLLFAGRVGTLLPALPLLQEVLEIVQGFAG